MSDNEFLNALEAKVRHAFAIGSIGLIDLNVEDSARLNRLLQGVPNGCQYSYTRESLEWHVETARLRQADAVTNKLLGE